MGAATGFIGAGKMAEALMAGMLKAGLARADELIASDISAARRDAVRAALGIETTAENARVFEFARTVVLAVKPQHAGSVLDEAREHVRPHHLIVSIMAGVPTAAIEARLPAGTRVVRVMPNTACLVQAAASGVAKGTHATDADLRAVVELFNAVGRAEAVDEKLLDAVTGLSGSGPAYIFTVIEALADGGVAEGLPRETALRLAAQTVMGAGKMVLESGQHPALLREQVTSPAGTTAEGLAVLEAHGVRSAFLQAVRAAARRSKALGEGTSKPQ